MTLKLRILNGDKPSTRLYHSVINEWQSAFALSERVLPSGREEEPAGQSLWAWS